MPPPPVRVYMLADRAAQPMTDCAAAESAAAVASVGLAVSLVAAAWVFVLYARQVAVARAPAPSTDLLLLPPAETEAPLDLPT